MLFYLIAKYKEAYYLKIMKQFTISYSIKLRPVIIILRGLTV